MLEILEAVDGPIRGQAPFDEEGNGPLNHKLEGSARSPPRRCASQLEKVTVADLASARSKHTVGEQGASVACCVTSSLTGCATGGLRARLLSLPSCCVAVLSRDAGGTRL